MFQVKDVLSKEEIEFLNSLFLPAEKEEKKEEKKKQKKGGKEWKELFVITEMVNIIQKL